MEILFLAVLRFPEGRASVCSEVVLNGSRLEFMRFACAKWIAVVVEVSGSRQNNCISRSSVCLCARVC